MFIPPIAQQRLDAVKRFLLRSQLKGANDLAKHMLWFLADSSFGLVMPVKASFVEAENGFTKEDIETAKAAIMELLADESDYSLNKALLKIGARMQFFAFQGYHSHASYQMVLGDKDGAATLMVFLCGKPVDPWSKDITYFETTKSRLCGTGLMSHGLEELYVKKAA